MIYVDTIGKLELLGKITFYVISQGQLTTTILCRHHWEIRAVWENNVCYTSFLRTS